MRGTGGPEGGRNQLISIGKQKGVKLDIPPHPFKVSPNLERSWDVYQVSVLLVSFHIKSQMKIPPSILKIEAGHKPIPIMDSMYTGCASFCFYVKQIILAHKEGFYI